MTSFDRPACSKPLIPMRLRPLAATFGVAMVMTLIVLCAKYHNGTHAGRLDSAIASAIVARFAPAGTMFGLIVRLGNPRPLIVISIGLAMVALLLKHYRAAVLGLISPGAAVATAEIMKPVVGRTYYGALAFPSGHTGALTAAAMVVGIMIVSFSKCHPLAAVVLATGGVVTAGTLMAVGLLAQGKHYPSDILGGFLTAIIVVLAIAFCIDVVFACLHKAVALTSLFR